MFTKVKFNSHKDEIQEWLHDASNFKGDCDTVFFPKDHHELNSLLKKSNADKVKVTISGSRTGLTGGCVPQGGILISTVGMNTIWKFNRVKMIVTCDPGVLLSDLQAYLKERGFFFPADPTETFCTVGGIVANNSSGARSFKYGPTRNYVAGVYLMLPDGDTIRMRRGDITDKRGVFAAKTLEGKVLNIRPPRLKVPAVKNAAGYYSKEGADLLDLITGSEGTLGVITRIKLNALPIPEKLLSCVAFFKNIDDALQFVSESRAEGRGINGDPEIDPLTNTCGSLSALEFFDANALLFLKNDYPNIPENMEAGVWFEVETTENTHDEVTAYWLNKLERYHSSPEDAWYAADDQDAAKIKEFRHAISYKVNEYIAQNGFYKLGTDTAVPVAEFDEYYKYSVNLVKEDGLDYVAYGHFGDCHLHLNMLPKNEEEFAKGKEIYLQLCKKAVESGGTVSAEHGIGKLKKEYLKLMYGESGIAEMKRVKRYFDPSNILNTGNLFD